MSSSSRLTEVVRSVEEGLNNDTPRQAERTPRQGESSHGPRSEWAELKQEHCFTSETLVLCEGGELREIQWVGAGSIVLSRCERTSEVAYKLVTHSSKRAAQTCCIFFRRDGLGSEVMIEATVGQLFWVKDKGWTEAQALISGDAVVTFGGQQLAIDHVEPTFEEMNVYNIEVADFHTHFVGRSGVWVHDQSAFLGVGKESCAAPVEVKDAANDKSRVAPDAGFSGEACFVGSTKVVLEDGELRDIEFVGVGDLVLARDETAGELGYRRVLKTFEHADVQTCRLRFDDGTTIRTTLEHRFWLEGYGWTEVGDLKPGDVLGTFDGRRPCVTGVEDNCGRAYVYSLEVEEFHTYFVGFNGAWVHDTKGTEIERRNSPRPDLSTTELKRPT